MYFSILIPVYNKEKEVRTCLESALRQTFSDLEIIVVDDGSKDASADVIREYSEKDSRVILIQNEKNESLLYSRMKGMQNAKGKYILLVDADDYLEETACQTLHDELEKEPVDILDFQFVREPSKVMGVWPERLPDDIPKAILTCGYNYNVWHRCYSKDLVNRLLDKTESFYCNMSEDGFFFVAFAVLAKSYKRIPDCLYHYVVGPGMSTNDYQTIEEVEAAVSSMQEKTKRLTAFLERNRPDLLDYVDGFYRNDLKKIVQLSTKDSVEIGKQIELLRHMDELCGSSYAEERTSEFLSSVRLVRQYRNANIRGKAKILIDAFRKDVIKKTCKKLLGKRKYAHIICWTISI